MESWQPRVRALLEQQLGLQAIYDRLRLENPDFSGSLGSLKRLVGRLKRQRGVAATDVKIPVDTEPGVGRHTNCL